MFVIRVVGRSAFLTRSVWAIFRVLMRHRLANRGIHVGFDLHPRAAIASLRRLTEGQAMTVTLDRGGERKTLSLDGSIVVNTRPRT